MAQQVAPCLTVMQLCHVFSSLYLQVYTHLNHENRKLCPSVKEDAAKRERRLPYLKNALWQTLGGQIATQTTWRHVISHSRTGVAFKDGPFCTDLQ